jgi:hypothetical protein
VRTRILLILSLLATLALTGCGSKEGDTVSGGYVAGNIILAIVLIVALGFLVAGLPYGWDGLVPTATGVALALFGGGIWFASTWPFKYDYHHWVTKQGAVTQVSSRIISKDDEVSQRFVVVLADGGTYGVDDTRAALLKSGDQVRLKCKKEYEWGTAEASQGWGCKWAGLPR